MTPNPPIPSTPWYANLLAPLIGFFLGVVLTRWWDRARPLVLLKGVANVTALQTHIKCPPEIAELTRKSWHYAELRDEEITLGAIKEYYVNASISSQLDEDALPAIDRILTMLSAEMTREDAIKAYHDTLEHRGLSAGIDIALKRNEIVVNKPTGWLFPVIIQSEKVADNDGCFRITFNVDYVDFSSNLTKQKSLISRIHNFHEGIKHADPTVLRQVLTQLRPKLSDQARYTRQLVEALDPIRNENGRWAVKLIVANYGSAL